MVYRRDSRSRRKLKLVRWRARRRRSRRFRLWMKKDRTLQRVSEIPTSYFEAWSDGGDDDIEEHELG